MMHVFIEWMTKILLFSSVNGILISFFGNRDLFKGVKVDVEGHGGLRYAYRRI